MSNGCNVPWSTRVNDWGASVLNDGDGNSSRSSAEDWQGGDIGAKSTKDG